jgi:hypothetical protein
MRTSNGRVKRKNKPNNGIRLTRVYKDHARSRVTNGRSIVPKLDGLDQRGFWCRRLRDLIALHTQDLGGADNMSEAEKAILRRACVMLLELEQREAKFALNGEATDLQLEQYSRVAGNTRRLLESLGLARRSKNVTPDLQSYLRMKGKGDVIDAEANE